MRRATGSKAAIRFPGETLKIVSSLRSYKVEVKNAWISTSTTPYVFEASWFNYFQEK